MTSTSNSNPTLAGHVILKTIGLGDGGANAIQSMIDKGMLPQPIDRGGDPATWRFDREAVRRKISTYGADTLKRTASRAAITSQRFNPLAAW